MSALALDLRGHGASGGVNGAGMIDDVLAALDALAERGRRPARGARLLAGRASWPCTPPTATRPAAPSSPSAPRARRASPACSRPTGRWRLPLEPVVSRPGVARAYWHATGDDRVPWAATHGAGRAEPLPGAAARDPRRRAPDPPARPVGARRERRLPARAPGAVSAGLDRLAAEVAACRACPRLVAWREEVGRARRAAYADEEYWARPLPGLRRSRPLAGAGRPRPGGPRRQPHRADVHRRPQRRLPGRRAAPRRARLAAHLGPRRRRPAPDRVPHDRGRALRAAGQPPDARRARPLPPVPGRGARPLPAGDGAAGPRGAGLGGDAARPGGPAAQAALRPRRRGRPGPRHAAGLVPPEPAEHLHRAPDPGRCSTPSWPGRASSTPPGGPEPAPSPPGARAAARAPGPSARSISCTARSVRGAKATMDQRPGTRWNRYRPSAAVRRSPVNAPSGSSTCTYAPARGAPARRTVPCTTVLAHLPALGGVGSTVRSSWYGLTAVAAAGMQLEVQVGLPVARVPGVADRRELLAHADPRARLEARQDLVEVRVVVRVAGRVPEPDPDAPEAGLGAGHAVDDAVGHGDHGRAAGGQDVVALVRSLAARRAEVVGVGVLAGHREGLEVLAHGAVGDRRGGRGGRRVAAGGGRRPPGRWPRCAPARRACAAALRRRSPSASARKRFCSARTAARVPGP